MVFFFLCHRHCWLMAKSYAAGECMSLREIMEREAARERAEAEAAATGGGGEAGGIAATETEARVRAETAAYVANAAAYAANEARAARRRALLEAEEEAGEGGEGGGGEGGGGPVAEAQLAEPILQATPSALPVIAVIARRLPSAQATLVSPAEAALYETADAEVTSSAV